MQPDLHIGQPLIDFFHSGMKFRVWFSTRRIVILPRFSFQWGRKQGWKDSILRVHWTRVLIFFSWRRFWSRDPMDYTKKFCKPKPQKDHHDNEPVQGEQEVDGDAHLAVSNATDVDVGGVGPSGRNGQG